MNETSSPEPNGRGLTSVHPQQVAQVRASMPTNREIVDLADVFSLLGDSGRVSILIALLAGRMAVKDISAVVEQSESAVSHALRLLRAHRVVDVDREGRFAYYALADAHVRVLIELALEHVGHTVLPHAAGGTELDDRLG
ncbi:helix-turn-helix transcriptional regulator [Candidatus Aquiluna sp. UB-MaderosW2red]|uniref:ArsR/SmtB family transcription factor n=1 Tax=Candidatus Aquiluna sp. UB-MaderosW2red TaxID=1855377 RepID=UPI000875B05F|nr:metalloregulator ArsR/SmtB family transcription factor [Candidatus Aquiluna sp. UB-MaderosW2red]SCX14959.1 DNA-binding transcriptional regulator, ArsR family [Candidatus Aquiluna sp. UB-MaderosW2red]